MKVPTTQGVHALDPTAPLKLPAEHAEQAVPPLDDWYVPEAQLVHTLDDANEYHPAAHAAHTVDVDAPTTLDTVPAPQPTQIDAPTPDW